MATVANRVNKQVLRKSNELVATLQAKGVRVRSAYLYGSQAMGCARRGSDIDIAIISPDLSGDWLDDYCYLTRMADEVDARMEVISFLPKDFHNGNPLVWEIKTKGIPLLPPRKSSARRKRTTPPKHSALRQVSAR